MGKIINEKKNKLIEMLDAEFPRNSINETCRSTWMKKYYLFVGLWIVNSIKEWVQALYLA